MNNTNQSKEESVSKLSPKDYHVIAKSANEDQIRYALIEVLEIISNCEMLQIDATTSNQIRRLRLEAKSYSIAATALRAGIARFRQAQRLQMNNGREEPMQMTNKSFALVLKAITAVQRVPKEQIEKTSIEDIIKPPKEDPIATRALGKIGEMIKAGATPDEMRAYGENLKRIEENALFVGLTGDQPIGQQPKPPSVEDEFKPNENGEVEL